ncbi:hypothetical protein HUK65_06320 [Rhodobacteraceae bacterium 2376]|uniref:Uncharacterized protein n=1 Tax=Rhabdonatronobacter sediminivivens TaxID=2743469 RepID=A0A7Z0HYZ0_9RHOB|nr:hypothetical protein [Rhabdonatronobacter sediminivivens]NYS24602.1 hypothetical protein [Rhabdonatronobacter sediminivivens]
MTNKNPAPGNDTGLPSTAGLTRGDEIFRLCDEANAAMQEVALYVHSVNNDPALAKVPPRKRWTPERMARLQELQGAHGAIAKRIEDHPDGHIVDVTEGPVVGRPGQ